MILQLYLPKKNLFYQGIGQLVGKTALYVFFLITARFLGAREYGILSFCLSLCYLIGILMDSGLNHLSVKWIARGEFKKYLAAFKGRIFTIIFGLVIVGLTSILMKQWFRPSFIILGFAFGASSLLSYCYSFFRGKEIMQYEAWLVIFQRTILLVLALGLFYYYKASSITAAYTYFISNFVTLLPALWLLQKLNPSFFKRVFLIKNREILSELKEGLPLMIVGVFGIIYYRIDIIMLTYFQKLSEVGLYSGVYKLMEGSFLIPSIIMAAIFPKLSQYGKNKPKEFYIQGKRLFWFFLFLAIIIFIPLTILAPFLVKTFLGLEYVQSTALFKVLLISLFAVYPGHLVTQGLIIIDAQKTYMYVSIGGALINVVLNFLLIPGYGAMGAAWATIITEMVVTVGCLMGIKIQSTSI